MLTSDELWFHFCALATCSVFHFQIVLFQEHEKLPLVWIPTFFICTFLIIHVFHLYEVAVAQ